MKKSDQEWIEELGPERYRILRLKGTERPFTGELNDEYRSGVYLCGGCGSHLFDSDAKFNSGCGWPSFDRSVPNTVSYERDTSHVMYRTEILCQNCGGHLGHVFPDGPTKTGQRYCVYSLSISFEEKSKENPV